MDCIVLLYIAWEYHIKDYVIADYVAKTITMC
jgi:hypothetical protein